MRMTSKLEVPHPTNQENHLRRFIASITLTLTVLAGLVFGLGGVASANGLDGPGAYHTALVEAQSACSSYADFLITYDRSYLINTTWGVIALSGEAYQTSQALPYNFQQFYGAFATEISNVYTILLNSFQFDPYNEGLAYTACTWILAP
ncbi:MAG: hypothetical protein ACREQ5_13165 [Candidatus Dormibacteria bacterium]